MKKLKIFVFKVSLTLFIILFAFNTNSNCPAQLEYYELNGLIFSTNTQSHQISTDGSFFIFSNLNGTIEMGVIQLENQSGFRPIIKKVNSDMEVEVLRFLGEEGMDFRIFGVSLNTNQTWDVLLIMNEPFEDIENTGINSDKKQSLVLLNFNQDLSVNYAKVLAHVNNDSSYFGMYNMLLTHDNENNILIYGMFEGEVTFGNTIVNEVNPKFFISSYSSNFEINWSKTFGSSWGRPANITTNNNTGDIFIAFDFLGEFIFKDTSLTTTGLGNDIGIACLNNNGELKWVFHQPSLGTDYFSNMHYNNMEGLYLSAAIKGHWEMANDSVFLYSGSETDAILFKLDPATGTLGWSRHFYGSGRANILDISDAPNGILMLRGVFTEDVKIWNEELVHTGTGGQSTFPINSFISLFNTDGTDNYHHHLKSNEAIGISFNIINNCFYGHGFYQKDADFLNFNLIEDDADIRRFYFKTTFDNLISINESSNSHFNYNLKLWPNPVTAMLNIYNENYNMLNGSIFIYDISGKLVMLEYIDSKIATIDVSTIKDGMYILKFVDAENKIQIYDKFIINNKD